jgi:hypothetical protein
MTLVLVPSCHDPIDSRAEQTIKKAVVISNIRFLLYLSAASPEKKVVMINGTASLSPIIPKASLLCVIWYICQARTVLCMSRATVVSDRARRYALNSGILREAKASVF